MPIEKFRDLAVSQELNQSLQNIVAYIVADLEKEVVHDIPINIPH